MASNDLGGSVWQDIANMLTVGPTVAHARSLALRGQLYTQETRQMDPLIAQMKSAKESRSEVEYQMGNLGYVFPGSEYVARVEEQKVKEMLQDRQQNGMKPILDAIAERPDVAVALKAFQELQKGGKDYVGK